MRLVEFRRYGGGRVMICPKAVDALDDPDRVADDGTVVVTRGGFRIHVDHQLEEVAKRLGFFELDELQR